MHYASRASSPLESRTTSPNAAIVARPFLRAGRPQRLPSHATRSGRVQAASWSGSLLPDAQPRPPDPDAVEHEDGLARAIGEAHRRYTSFINARAGWTGHLFQNRFASVAMDEKHLYAAIRCAKPQSGPGASGGPRRGLAVVERPRAFGRRKRMMRWCRCGRCWSASPISRASSKAKRMRTMRKLCACFAWRR